MINNPPFQLPTTMVFQLPTTVSSHHNPVLQPNECSSTLFQTIAAPASVVWALVSDFENPQCYKPFVRSCRIIDGQANQVGCLRRVDVASGLPASYSIERLETLDHDQRIFGFSIVSGDPRLSNYRSIMSLHPNGDDETLVVEIYVIDAAEANTKEETCAFVDTIVKLNLRTLSRVAEDLAAKRNNSLLYMFLSGSICQFFLAFNGTGDIHCPR